MRITLVSILLLLMPVTVHSESGEWGEINDWLGIGFAQVYLTYPDKTTKSFQVGIADDPDGKQVIEFRYLDTKNNYCISTEYTDVVLVINDKRVKMKSGCKRMAMAYFITYFPVTDKGREYVADSFKRENKVSVRLQGYDLLFPANGFAEAWERYGGDAI